MWADTGNGIITTEENLVLSPVTNEVISEAKLTLNQQSHAVGLQVNGYDTQSGEIGELFVSSGGNTTLRSTKIMGIDSGTGYGVDINYSRVAYVTLHGGIGSGNPYFKLNGWDATGNSGS